MAKAGRPKSDNPKAQKLSFRLDEHTVKILDDYCRKYNISRSEAIRIGVEMLPDGRAHVPTNTKREERSIPAFLL